ncbi:PREDICTED: scavenger receptor class B member 1-like isoform X1 [Papilio xuthus]|uniref:Scavenger receptor class B member 1-like isoform X1 n=1 Tax=Papilio xuthus TaxID=66420 RepID=A0AAJ7EGK3_PAPXU|nr:PREDICTED: scavenger receptor class B member 1-like isoform X1 [Papilio xuthus]
MKDLAQIWNKFAGRQYASVNSAEKELRDLSHNRLKRADIDVSSFEQNFSECEGLNYKFTEELDFADRKDAIINRLFERRKKGQIARQPKCLFLFLMLGFFSLGAACFILFLRPYDFFFSQKAILEEGGEIFEMWRKPEVKLYCRVYLFNVTNAEEYMAGKHDKLKLQEVGPYVYRERLEHEVVQFNENGTLSAIPRHPLAWEEELSEGNKEDDVVYMPHIALLSIANVVSKQSFMTRFGLNNLISLTNTRPLARMTAREFMMGYSSKLMTLGNTFMPGWIYFDKLGLIDRMYDFEGDYETIFTGTDDVTNSGLIDTYRGSTQLPQWEDRHCSNVQFASDGTKFKSGVSHNQSILFYRKSLCRAAPLIPVGEGVRGGLKGFMYTFPEHMLDNGKNIKENKCFCRKGKCLPEGLIDVTDCYYGFPIALSYPHFYKGDDVLFSKVEGLTPNKEDHETRFWIQPDSGLPLDVSSKFQINMALDDISMITNTERFSNMYLPMLWFDIRMYSLTPSLEQRFNLYLNVLPVVEKCAMYFCFIIGAALILITTYILTFKIMFKNYNNGQNRKCNFNFKTNLWFNQEKTKSKKSCGDSVYAPCEIPLHDTESDNSDPQFDDKKPGFIKSHSEKIKELSNKLSDKVHGSVGNVKGSIRGELSQVKKAINERKNSLINPEAERSDSGEEYSHYKPVNQSDSDEECKYLEVIDDGSDFDDASVLSAHKNQLYINIG